MKKIIVILLLLCGTYVGSVAQTAQTKESKKNRKSTKVSKFATAKNDNPKTTRSTGLNTDGSPDMRLKVNKEAKASNEKKGNTRNNTRNDERRTTNPSNASTSENNTKPSKITNGVNNSSDKIIGQDNKGRTIYEGPRGGHYYINGNGNKEYIKKS